MIDEPPGEPAPPRLRHDPAFRADTGCDLADEGLAVGGYDLDRGKQRLLAAIAALPPPASGPSGGDAPSAPAPATTGGGALGAGSGVVAAVAGGVIVLMIGALVWLGGPSAPTAPVDPAPRAAPATAAAPAPAASAAPELPPEPAAAPPTALADAPAPRAAAGPAPRAILPAEPAPALTGPVEVLPTAEPIPAVVGAPIPTDPGPSGPAPSGLQADYQAFLVGDAKFKEGDWKAARAGYEAYLRDFPRGAMEPEARFGLLVALHQSGDAAAAEAQSRMIQDRTEFSSRRQEILRLRAESLVLLNRCEEALSLAEVLASKDAAEVRRVCRARRKEDP
jgi:TolA-binding protein